MDYQSDQNGWEKIIDGGSDIAGSVAGSAIGFIAGGPPLAVLSGAAAGPIIGRVIKRIGNDMHRRFLGPRERTRIGATAAFAVQAIQSLEKSGKTLRTDGFFKGDQARRPSADEILEGVLLKARDAYEEKKLPLLANLYANIAFHPEITPSFANHLVAVAGRLTYRQLVALSVAADSNYKKILRNRDYRGDRQAIQRTGAGGVSLMTEIYDLYQEGLVSDDQGSAWISVADVNPAGFQLNGVGGVLYQLMGLGMLSTEERSEFQIYLS